MRHRLGAYCRDNLGQFTHEVVHVLEIEMGVVIPWYGRSTLPTFFRDAELRDVLDAITHIHQRLIAVRYEHVAGPWKAYVTRVLAEEHTTYALTENCAVTFAVDELYAYVRKATLASLEDSRWSEARTEFERAFEALDRDQPDNNGAIRAIAAAVESASKVILGGAVSRVGASDIERHLAPIIRSIYAGDEAAINASQLMLKAYADWVNATHQYRHGQGVAHEGHAPLDLTVNMLTSGSATLRWLIGLDTSAVTQRPDAAATA
jgi:hypothetical protein